MEGTATRPGMARPRPGVDVLSEPRGSSRAANRQRAPAAARRRCSSPAAPSRISEAANSISGFFPPTCQRLLYHRVAVDGFGIVAELPRRLLGAALEHVEGVDVRRLAKGLNQVAGIEPRQRIGAAAGVGLGSREDRPEQFGRHRLVAARVDHRPAHVLHPRKDRRVRGQERAEISREVLDVVRLVGAVPVRPGRGVIPRQQLRGAGVELAAYERWTRLGRRRDGKHREQSGDADQGGAGRSNRCGAHVSSLLVNRSSLDSDEETTAIVAGAARKNQ